MTIFTHGYQKPFPEQSRRLLPLRAPVVQATLGRCDSVVLSTAVSNAGGLGTLSLHSPKTRTVQRILRQLAVHARRPVLLAFTAEWERDSVLDACLAAGHRHFQVFWWNGPRLAHRIRASGGVVFWQVGTGEQVVDALAHGVDILVAQSTEAGGPVRSPYSLADLIPLVRSISGPEIPLVAGGGLATRHDVAQTLAWGADAALLGTRFLLSAEASAPTSHKLRLQRNSGSRLFLDSALKGDWPCAPRRRFGGPRTPDTPSLFAGLGVGRIQAVQPAAQLVRMLTPRLYRPLVRSL
jgi:NAD(P)H-dependent flavin oxidoreductase YrpB (nitropropane dioxygenase family)